MRSLAKIGLAEEVHLLAIKTTTKVWKYSQHKENEKVYLWCPEVPLNNRNHYSNFLFFSPLAEICKV